MSLKSRNCRPKGRQIKHDPRNVRRNVFLRLKNRPKFRGTKNYLRLLKIYKKNLGG